MCNTTRTQLPDLRIPMSRKRIRVTHIPTGTVLVEGPIGWGITPFEGNLYIRRQFLKTDAFQLNFVPGFCPYKFFYLWMDLRLPGEKISRNIAWKYVLPSPLFPFIAFRVALPRLHPELRVEEFGVVAQAGRSQSSLQEKGLSARPN
jgi:uncharacterized protein (DUF427 family)